MESRRRATGTVLFSRGISTETRKGRKVHHTAEWEFEAGYSPVVLVSGEGGLRGAIGQRPGALRIELPGDHSIHLDPAGRIIHVHLEGVTCRRTLDSRLLVSRRVHGRVEGWIRPPAPDDPLPFLAARHEEIRALRAAAESSRSTCRVLRGKVDDPRAWVLRGLEAAAAFDRDTLRDDARALQELYLPIPILPPDQYGSLVVQVSEGCSWNRCRFCTFYREIPYRERSVREVTAHLDAVIAHLGGTLSRLHRVFLGQANALLVDRSVLLPVLHAITERLPLVPLELPGPDKERFRREHPRWIDGLYSFIDAFHRPKSDEEYRELSRAGVRRVYLGLESGSPGVLEILGKPPVVDEAVRLVRQLRRAGISTGVIVLVGAGGRRHALDHVERTLDVLRRMELGKGDQLYLSRLVIQEGGDYDRRARAEGLTPLDRAEQDEQIEAFRQGLGGGHRLPFPVASYDISLSRSVHPRGRRGLRPA